MAATNVNLQELSLPELLRFFKTSSIDVIKSVSAEREVPMTKNDKGRPKYNTYKFITVDQAIESFRKYGINAVYIETDKNGGNKPYIGLAASFNKAIYYDGQFYTMIRVDRAQLGGSVRPYEQRIESQEKGGIKKEDITHQPSLMFTNVLPKQNEDGSMMELSEDIIRTNELIYCLMIHDALVAKNWSNMVNEFGWKCEDEDNQDELDRANDARAVYGFKSNFSLRYKSSFKPYTRMIAGEDGKKKRTRIDGKFLLNLSLQKTNNVLCEKFMNVRAKTYNNNGKEALAEMTVNGTRLNVHNCHEVFRYGLHLTTFINLGSVRSGGTGTTNKISFGRLFDFNNRNDKTITVFLDPDAIKESSEDNEDKSMSALGSDLAAEYLATAKNIDAESAEVLNITTDESELDIDNDANVEAVLSMEDTV